MSEIEDRQLAQYTLQWADGATGQEVRLAFAVIEAQDDATRLRAALDRVRALRDRLAGLAPHTTSTASVVGRLTAALSEPTEGKS